MINQMNKRLQAIYQEWKIEVYDTFINDKEQIETGNIKYSAPFYAGIPEEFDSTKKTLLFVGQEASKWWRCYEDPHREFPQNHSVGYAQTQVGNNKEHNFNGSPFWRLFRKLSEKYNMVWTNIDKVHRIGGDKETLSLTLKDELALNSPFGKSGKTIFQNEIEIIDPDVILFVTGPNYYQTMAKAAGIDGDILYSQKPTPPNPVNEISNIIELTRRTFWSYHPRYLNSQPGGIGIIKVLDLLSNL